MGVENIKVEAMKVYFGQDIAQQEKITISPAILKADLASAFFVIYAVAAGVISKHVFWFDTTGTDVAPTVAGATLHKVDISVGTIDTAAEYAATLAAAMALITAYTATTALDNVVTVVHTNVGYAPAAHDSKDLLALTNFGFTIDVQGDTEDEVGCIDGDIELAFDESFVDVKCHAHGATMVAQLKNGVNSSEVTLNLEELTKERLKKMFVKTGGSFIPTGGTEVFGMGTFKAFENMFKFATKLRLHPVRLLDADISEDWNFHLALPNLKGITFSGEKVLTLPVTFKIYPDDTKDARISYFAIGDGSQSLA